jgi:hypothetical protein
MAASLTLELVAGCAAGIALAYAGGWVAGRLFQALNFGWGGLAGAILAALASYAIGVSTGVYVVGKRFNGRGSYWPALLGSALAAVLVLALAEPLRLNRSPSTLALAAIISAPIIATIAFNLSLRSQKDT